jgi:hypothetical protein
METDKYFRLYGAGMGIRRGQEDKAKAEFPSKLGKEFGIKNEKDSLNCFINVCLQALWIFPQVRFYIKQFSEQKSEGPERLAPLINSICKFYATAQHL